MNKLTLNTVEEVVKSSTDIDDFKVNDIKQQVVKTIADVKVGDLKVADIVADLPTDVKNPIHDIGKFLNDLFNDSDNKLKELKIKLSFPISDDVSNFIKLVINESPDSLKKISKTLEDILSDGVLDYSDVPKLVSLITQLNNTDFKKLTTTVEIKTDVLLDFIKVLMHSMIELNFVKVNNKEKMFELLDTSLLLLTTTLSAHLPSGVNMATCFAWCQKK